MAKWIKGQATERKVNMNSEPVYIDGEAGEDRFYYYKKVFFYSLLISVAIMLPFVIVELIKVQRPIFLYYGDYNVQQICFYRHCVDMVRNGDFGWDWYTDLGSNFIGSYSYYMLGSPFFWILCLFPASWTPYLMAPTFVLKYVTCALFSYAYIKRFVRKQNYAVVGALLYTFSGFQIYNTFFNQFHEVVTLFPLLLLGMEELVQNNRRGLFALAVALNAACNYFMFAGQVAFCILYFVFRLSQKSFKITFKKFGLLAFEAVLGVAMGCIIFLPGALAVWDNPRISGGLSGINMLIYRRNGQFYWQRYGHLLESFFFPPDIPSRVNFFYGHEERWASIAAYLPMFGVSGVFAHFASKKRPWLKYFTMFLILCLFVPVLNSMFFKFEAAYYARWMYMLLLMMSLGTVVMAEDDSVENDRKWKGGIIAYLIGASVIFLPLGLLWYENTNTSAVDYKLGYPPYIDRFWIYVGITLLSIAILWYLFTRLRRKKIFEFALLIATSVITVLYSVIHIAHGKQHSWSSEFLVNRAIEGRIDFDESEFARMDMYRYGDENIFDNLGIFWKVPSIECFHTVVPPSIMKFYPYINVTRNVGSRAVSSLYGLRAFTSTKYSIVDEGGRHDALGFKKIGTQNGFDIYENENYLPMGFAYTEFMTQSEMEKVYVGTRHALLCTYLVVPDDMADYYRQFMKEVKFMDEDRITPNYDNFKESVEERRTMCTSSFEYSSKGFEAKIHLDKPNIVFFSVPMDDGWSVTVNGEKKDVLSVYWGGFVAVECGAGDNEIVFTYRTPGLTLGALLTFGGFLIWGLYIYFGRKWFGRAEYKFFKEDYYDDETVPVAVNAIPLNMNLQIADSEPAQDRQSAQSVSPTDVPSGEQAGSGTPNDISQTENIKIDTQTDQNQQ